MVAWAVALWRAPVHERRMAAVEILTLAAPRLRAADLATVERLLRESGTWALVDGLPVSVAGEIALRDQRSWPVIDGWAADADFWLRRSALLALLRGIRTGSRTCPGLPGTRSRCWRSASSSSARPLAGCCGRSQSTIRTGSRPGRSGTCQRCRG